MIFFVFSFFAVIVVLAIISYILSVIGLWKMFRKTEKPGWAALIPIYNTYMLCNITGISPWWLLIYWVSVIISIFIPILGILTSFVNAYFSLLLAVSIARSFSRQDAYAIGLFLLPCVFYIVFGFDDSKYAGPKPMTDVIFHNFQKM